MKSKHLVYSKGKFPIDVRDIDVDDYKNILGVGNLVKIDGKKYIVMDKKDYKCKLMGLDGRTRNCYYKCIDYMYMTLETSRDNEIIEFMGKQNLGDYSVVDYEKDEHQFRCEDGNLHSYSFLFNKFLRRNKGVA